MAYRIILNAKFLVLTPLLLLLFIAVACGGGDATDAAKTATDGDKSAAADKSADTKKDAAPAKKAAAKKDAAPAKKAVVEKSREEKKSREEGLKGVAKDIAPKGIPTVAPKKVDKKTESTVQTGGIGKCSAYSAAAFWDLHRGAAANDVVWASMLYNGLIELNPETDDWFDIRGDLATSWDVSKDGLAFTFHLAEGAKWHDGKPVTAEDVVFSIDRMVDPNEPRPRAGLIKPYYERGTATAIDAVTVKVPTKFPSAAFGGFMAADYNKIYPKHVYAPEADGGQGINPNKTDTIIGSGPFTLPKFKKDVMGEFRKFDDYWKKDDNGVQRPYLDGIDKFLIIDRGTLAANVRTGGIDFSCGEMHLEIDVVLALEKELEGKLQLYFDLPGIYWGFWVNTKHLPWSDVRMREALHLAIDRKEVIAAIGPVGSELPGAPLQPGSWFGKDPEELWSKPGYRYPKDEDIARARELVKEVMKDAGLDFPYKYTFRFRNVAAYPLQAPVVKEQLARIGLDAELEMMESAAGFQAWERGDAEMALQGTSFAVFEPDAIVNTFFTEGAGRNYPDYKPDPIIGELFIKQAKEFDQAKRREILQQIEDHILDNFDTPWTHMYWAGRGRFASSKVQNYHAAQSSQGELKFEHIWLKQ